jgi:hypothetical protein
MAARAARTAAANDDAFPTGLGDGNGDVSPGIHDRLVSHHARPRNHRQLTGFAEMLHP